MKPKAVAGISQLFQTSDVIARYTGVINRQIKTPQRDHGCLKRPRQIIKAQIPVPHHYFFMGPHLSWHQEYTLSLVLHRCAMYWVYVMSHLYGHVRRHCPSPVITSVQLLSLTTLFTQRGVGRAFIFSCTSRYTHSRSSAIDFPAVAN